MYLVKATSIPEFGFGSGRNPAVFRIRPKFGSGHILARFPDFAGVRKITNFWCDIAYGFIDLIMH